MRITALVVLLFAIAPTAAARASTHGCRLPVRAKVQQESDTAIVYTVRRSAESRGWRACWKATGRRTRLVREYNDSYSAVWPERLQLIGRFAGFVHRFSSHYNDGADDIVVYDLARGRRVYRVGRVAWTTGYATCDAVTLDALVFNSRGFAAWAASTRFGPCDAPEPSRTTVYARGSRGRIALERGRGRVEGLRLAGDELSWLRDGAPRSASLR